MRKFRYCFFIVGPENTGNHLLALLFENASYRGKKCFSDYIGQQNKGFQLLERFAFPELVTNKDLTKVRDLKKFKNTEKLEKVAELKDIIGTFTGDIVYRTSVPAASQHPPLLRIAKSFEDEGYKIKWIVPTRDFYCAIRSKETVRRCKNFNDGLKKLQEEYKYIFDAILKHGGDFWLFPITYIFLKPELIIKEMKIFYDLDVDLKVLEEIYNADGRWIRKLFEGKKK